MKKSLLIYIFIGIITALNAQTDKALISENIKKANFFMYSDIDSALNYARFAINLAQKNTSNKAEQFEAFRTLGLIYEENNRLTEAKQSYQVALILAENNLSDTARFKIYTDWAIIHKKLGQYRVAYDYHNKTIEGAEKIRYWEMVENGYHGLGTMYSMMSDFDQSIQAYHKSIEAADKWKNTEGVVLTNQNISNIYLKAQNYEMAKRHIEKTFAMAQKHGDSVRLGAVLRVYGKIELALGHIDLAIEKNIAAKNIFEKKGKKPRLAESYLALAQIYAQQNNIVAADSCFSLCDSLKTYMQAYTLAEYYTSLGKFYQAQNLLQQAESAFKTSLLTTDSLGFKEIARDNHLGLAYIFKKNNLLDSAFAHIEKANQLNEVLFKDDKQKIMTEAQFKYDMQNFSTQIAVQKKSLQLSVIIRSILFGALCIVSLLLIFTWYQMKAKQKANEYAELLMKELHHRVKNNLQTVTSIMRLQARHVADTSVAAVLSESQSRLEAISMIHQQLYSSESVQSINFRYFLLDLVDKLRFTYGMSEIPFKVEIEMKEDFMNVDIAMPMGLIINELLTNSFKYAYPSVKKPKLTIHLKDKKMYYADNGKGLPDDFDIEKTNTFGLQIVSSLAEQLRGKYKFGNNNGMYFELTFH